MFKTNQHFRLAMFLLLLTGLVLAACSGTSGSNSPVDVKVTLTDFGIQSSLTTFKVGVPYHFIVTNQGAVVHEFDIMPPDSSQLTPEQVGQKALAQITQDSLGPGASATLDYTFKQAYPEGQLEFACHVAGHYEAGMHTPIIVTQ